MTNGENTPSGTSFLSWIHGVRDGAMFRSIRTGDVEKLWIVAGPPLALPSGHLVFEDVDYLRESSPFGDCRIELPKGDSPTILGAFLVSSGLTPTYSPVVCIIGEPDKALAWELAGRVVSDRGAVCAYDLSTRGILGARLGPDDAYFTILDELVSSSTFVGIEGSGNTSVVFHCGLGSGAYPIWKGLGADGCPVCAVADLATLAFYEPIDLEV